MRCGKQGRRRVVVQVNREVEAAWRQKEGVDAEVCPE
jgi:hypothetical protein